MMRACTPMANSPPPTAEALLYGILQLQRKIRDKRVFCR